MPVRFWSFSTRLFYTTGASDKKIRGIFQKVQEKHLNESVSVTVFWKKSFRRKDVRISILPSDPCRWKIFSPSSGSMLDCKNGKPASVIVVIHENICDCNLRSLFRSGLFMEEGDVGNNKFSVWNRKIFSLAERGGFEPPDE